MSYILAIDTSTDACSVAISGPEGIRQIQSVAPREHTQRLLPSIETLLAEQQLSLSQCDAIAFGVGPGSFTGLRIALSTAQGLAYGANLPLIPISTLHTMAQTASRLHCADRYADGNKDEGKSSLFPRIIPTIDARMNEVYWSVYVYNASIQQMEAVVQEQLCSPETLSESPELEQPFCAVGSGWKYSSLSDTLVTRSVANVTIDAYPEAYDLALLAATAFAKDPEAAIVDPQLALPTYIRDEVSWKKRQRIRDVTV